MRHLFVNRCVESLLICLCLTNLLLCGCDVKPNMGKGGNTSTKTVVGEKELFKTLDNLKYLLFSMHQYHDAHQTIPPAYTVDASGKPLHSWRVLILPYIDQKALYDQIRLNEPWDSEYNKQFHNRDVATFHSGATNSPKGFTDFSMVVGPDTITDGPTARLFSAIPDGTSNTIILVERATPVCWMDPTEVTQEAAVLGFGASPEGMAAFYNGGERAIVGMMDGGAMQVRTADATPDQIQIALSRASGQRVTILQNVTRD